jgi:hypothetical protein
MLITKGPPQRGEFEIVEEPCHSFIGRPNLSITDESLDPREAYGRREGIEVRRVAEDKGRMSHTVQFTNRSLNTPIGKYPQSPAPSDGKIAKG